MTKIHTLMGSALSMILAVALAVQTICAQMPTPAQGQTPSQAPQGNPQPTGTAGQNGGDQPTELESQPILPFQTVGYSMELPYQIAAEVLAQDYPSPKLIVDIGSHQGEFLEPFLERFPAARGQWTEPVTHNEGNAKAKLGRFGNRVDYVIGCPDRDISQGCVPMNADVIITAWITSHQELNGIKKIYQLADAQLPQGGWLIILDHISVSDSNWERRFKLSRYFFDPGQEGPAPESGVNAPPPTVNEQLAAFKAAGFDDVEVVWRSFTACLFMAHKK